MENRETNRYAFIDSMKVLSIFFVIFYHAFMVNTDILNNHISAKLNYFGESIFSICVPIFFLVNGFLILNKSFDLKRHTIKMVKLIICTIFWNTVCTVLNMFLKQELFTVKDLILKIVDADYMWFLQALFVIYVFAPLIKHIFDTNKKIFNWFLGIVLILTFGNEFLSIVANICEYILGVNYIDFSFNFFGDFNAFRGIYGYAIGYFMIGGIANTLAEKCSVKFLFLSCILSWVCLFTFGCIMTLSNGILYDIVFQGYDKVFTLSLSLSIFLIAKKKNFVLKSTVFTYISKSTLGIYCIQQPIVLFCKRTFSNFMELNFVCNLLFAVIILLTCAGIIYILKKIPIMRDLITL